jgi:hypothetical protein
MKGTDRKKKSTNAKNLLLAWDDGCIFLPAASHVAKQRGSTQTENRSIRYSQPIGFFPYLLLPSNIHLLSGNARPQWRIRVGWHFR